MVRCLKREPQTGAERIIRTGNAWMLLLLAFATALIFYSLPVMGSAYARYVPYLQALLLAGAAVVYYDTAMRLYGVLKAVSAEVDRMVDQILDGTENAEGGWSGIGAGVRPDDGIFSKICDRLKKLYDAKALSVQRAKEETAAVHTLISDISHQVKTPAANIKIYIGMLEKRIEQADGRFYLDVLNKQADKLEFLMKTLVKMSRLETKLISLQIRDHKLLHILASALGTVVAAAKEKQIRIRTECPPQLMVAADERWTAEAVFNVLDNAVKYTDEGGEIQISAAALQSYVSLEIMDNGRGILREELPLIFQRFYRSPDVQDMQGAGLGLALTREILMLEHGYITADANVGAGSCFRILLPKGTDD